MGKVINSLDTLGSVEIEIKLMTFKLTMLLALSESSRAHKICYLEIRYLIRNSFVYSLYFSTSSSLRKQQRKN